MRFGFWPMPGTPWPDVLALARQAEAVGFDGIWYADHFMPNEGDLTKPVNESWTALAALAASVPRVRLGHLVNGNTYRHPAVLAKMAAGIDVISEGRFVLGLGAGWQENEHTAYGIHFGTLGERLRRMEEACVVVTRLLRNDSSSFDGKHYQLHDAPLSPKPVQERLPLMIGAAGEKVALRIVSHYADEWNAWGLPDVIAHKSRVLDTHCNRIRRDPATIQRSAVALVLMAQGRSHARLHRRRLAPRAHRRPRRDAGGPRRLRRSRRRRIHRPRLAPGRQPGGKERLPGALHHRRRRPLPLTAPFPPLILSLSKETPPSPLPVPLSIATPCARAHPPNQKIERGPGGEVVLPVPSAAEGPVLRERSESKETPPSPLPVPPLHRHPLRPSPPPQPEDREGARG